MGSIIDQAYGAVDKAATTKPGGIGGGKPAGTMQEPNLESERVLNPNDATTDAQNVAQEYSDEEGPEVPSDWPPPKDELMDNTYTDVAMVVDGKTPPTMDQMEVDRLFQEQQGLGQDLELRRKIYEHVGKGITGDQKQRLIQAARRGDPAAVTYAIGG